MILTARAPDAAAFAPFGAILRPPTDVGGRWMFSEWLEPVPGLSPRYHLNRVAPSAVPVTVNRVEHHPHAAQLFIPMGVSRYLVTVMPSDDAGDPDPGRAVAFQFPGTLGVAYRTGAWHAGITVLDTEASFAVLMWRGGETDDVFASIPPITVRAAGSAADRPAHG